MMERLPDLSGSTTPSPEFRDNGLSTLESEITAMAGVLAASLEADPEAGIRKVNIIARQGVRSRGQMVQDTISLVFVRSGIRLPSASVDVIECSHDGLVGGAGRPRLVVIETHSTREGSRVQVTLTLDGTAAEGFAPADAGVNRNGSMIAGVGATLRAAEELMSHRLSFRPMDVRSLEFAGEEVVLTVVSVEPSVGSGLLVGSSRVQGDPLEAAARAALDAINRTFTFD